MNRTAGPEGAVVDEITTGLRPGVPAPTNKPYGNLFSGILIFDKKKLLDLEDLSKRKNT